MLCVFADKLVSAVCYFLPFMSSTQNDLIIQYMIPFCWLYFYTYIDQHDGYTQWCDPVSWLVHFSINKATSLEVYHLTGAGCILPLSGSHHYNIDSDEGNLELENWSSFSSNLK